MTAPSFHRRPVPERTYIMWFTSRPRNQKRQASPRKRPIFRPTLEALEDRWVPSALTVLNNLDSGAGSLRAEIAAAHNSDTVVFASCHACPGRSAAVVGARVRKT